MSTLDRFGMVTAEWDKFCKATGTKIDLDDYVRVDRYWSELAGQSNFYKRNAIVRVSALEGNIRMSPTKYGDDVLSVTYTSNGESATTLLCRKGRVFDIISKAVRRNQKTLPCPSGYEEQLRYLRKVCKAVKHDEIDYSYGILLHGAPGNGKTMFCRKAASFLRSHWVSGTSMHESLANKQLFSNSGLYILDDVDISFFNRSGGNTLSCDLLSAMDGEYTVPSIRLFCTNEAVDDFDPAFLRPGRIDKIIQFNPPTDAEVDGFISTFPERIAHQINNSQVYGCSYAEIDSIRKYVVRQEVIDEPVDLNDVMETFGRSHKPIKKKVGFATAKAVIKPKVSFNIPDLFWEDLEKTPSMP